MKPHKLRMQLVAFCFFVIFRAFITVPVINAQPLPYIDEDVITLDCGSSGNNTRLGDNRLWDGDFSSKLGIISGASMASKVVEPLSSPTDEVPYRTARFSLSDFTYNIPVVPGPKLIRLYFYYAKYNNFDSLNASFSVKAGPYTLLHNFSVFLTADALGKGDVVKEFCIMVENSSLNITFSPSSSIPGTLAFINGIEVVHVPNDLYYPEDQGRHIKFVGEENPYLLRNNTALENVYRVNIGGGVIVASQDSGFFRTWEGMESEYSLYLTPQGVRNSVLPVEVNVSLLKFTTIRPYMAPANVYQTARSMGLSDSVTKSYNLTWKFPVDSGFYYMARLHFCEIERVINSSGCRRFNIYIVNQSVERNADVFYWSGGQYVPYFRDYIVWVIRTAGERKASLSIALQANPNDWETLHADAILNGVEIFKLNDSHGNLAGPNPDPIPHAAPHSQQQDIEAEKGNRTTVVVILCSLIIPSIMGIFFILRGRIRRVNWCGPISFITAKSSKTEGSSTLPSDLCRYFSLAEIKVATNNFDDIFIIGMGGFGNVYKGYIDDGTTPVAIKRLKSESSQGAHEFKTEIEMLSHLRHRHLVSLIGYCNEDREMILVYDYMARGTLRGHLYNTENPPLTWRQRLDICIGAARGLHYLHTGTSYTIIHRDVKTTNILLDEKWVAKVSDFGLSKMGPTTMSKSHVSTAVKGSFGYLDPEYYRRQQLSEKSDVYSFGVVLCEVLCGRLPIMRNAEKGQVSLAEWAQSCYHNGTLYQIIDPNLTGKIVPECLKKYGEIAVNCMHDNGTERPSMNDVVWGLEFAMQLQQNAEDNDRTGGAIMEVKGKDEVAFLNNNNSDGTFTCSWEESSVLKSSGVTRISSSEQGSTTNESMRGMPETVFSEINDPKGR